MGKTGAGKSSVANRLLSTEAENKRGGEHVGQNLVRREGEHAGRKLTVVDTPGWDRTSINRTPAHIKEEIIQSPTLCLPGPHALLLVLPISMSGNSPSASEIKSTSHHIELLSARAWGHTIVLFVCQDKVDTAVIDQHVQKAKKLIDKCGGRSFILHTGTKVSSLIKRIEGIVDENCGDFLIPQVYYEVFEKRIVEQHETCEKIKQELKQHKMKLKKVKAELQKLMSSPRRRESIDKPPNCEYTVGLIYNLFSFLQTCIMPKYAVNILVDHI